MKRKRILIIENSIHVTGALKSITHTCYDLKNSFDFIFVLPRHSKGRSFVESQGFLVIYELPLLELSRKLSSWLFYIPMLLINAFRLKRIIRKENIRLIHVNDLYNLLPITVRITGQYIPYICHVRFLPNRFPKKLFSFWLNAHAKYAQYIICVSNFLKEKIPDNPKIKMIYDGHPSMEQHPYPLSKSETLLYLSNIIRGKGHEYAVEAFSQLAVSYPTWKLRFVGGNMGLPKNSEFKKELISICEQKGISDQVEWIDFVQDVEKEYKSASIFLNFSESESFSMTCVEAQFFGCPVIATRSGGPAEIVIDHQTGFLIPKRDINSMVSAMHTLMKDDSLRTTFAENGRKIVRQRFSVSDASNQLQQLYNNALLKQ
jgi:L-malate glycosyltransferase